MGWSRILSILRRAAAEPRLELLPALDDPTAAEELEEDGDEANEEPEEPEATAAVAPLEATQDPLKLYVRQIGDGRLLTPAEERELARRKDAGDESAKQKLIESNLRLACRSRVTTRRRACRCST